MANEGISVLDSMAKGIMERKTEKAKGTLTPVSGEAAHVAGEAKAKATTVAAPEQAKQLDDVRNALARAQTQALQLREGVAQLIEELGQASWYNEMGPSEIVSTPLTVNWEAERVQLQKEVEAAADTAAAERTAAIQTALQKEAERPLTKQEARDLLTGNQAEAMESLVERMVRLGKEAQDQVFAKPEPMPEPDTPDDGLKAAVGWTCPEHHQAIEKTSARKGRKYRACPVCADFEKE